MFHHTRCKSNCGNSGCDCDNMAESSSSGSYVPQVHHHHDETTNEIFIIVLNLQYLVADKRFSPI